VPATIRDVARESGVHISTVSRTFSAPHLVNPDTRTRVLACAEQLGYRPNRAARALITGRTYNVGLIVADIANPFFPPLIKAAESQARQRDYHIFVADSNEDAAAQAVWLEEVLAKNPQRWTVVTLLMSSCHITSTISIGSSLPETRAVPSARVRTAPPLPVVWALLEVVTICSRLASEAIRAAVFTASP